MVGAQGESLAGGYCLTITNAGGTSTARELEVRLDVAVYNERFSREMGQRVPIDIVTDARLKFGCTEAASVHPGATRRVHLMRFGHPEEIRRSRPQGRLGALPPGDLTGFVGAWAATSGAGDVLPWISDGEEYLIVLTLMGENFDATTFSGQLDIDRYELADVGQFADVRWSQPLSRLKQVL